MAKNKFGLDFDGFLELADQIDKMGGELLKEAVTNAMTKSKEYANAQIAKAMNESPFQFSQGRASDKGVGGLAKSTNGKNRPSTGKAKKSLFQVSNEQVEWEGKEAIAKIGADLKVAPELLILALGTPHIQGDRNLNNAIKVKGKYRKEASRIQQEEFFKVIKEAQND